MSDIEKSLAWLVVGTLNEHWPVPGDDEEDDDQLGPPCCVRNCGPCGALHALSRSDEGRAEVERLVRLTGFQEGGWSYWDHANDRLRWSWFESWWSRHKGCWSSNGEVGCYGDEEEDPKLASKKENKINEH